MKNSERGFLFFYDWRKVFEKLSARDFKKMFFAMMDYQEKGGEIPQFSGVSQIVADLVFPQIERRKYISDINRSNVNKRWRSEKSESPKEKPYYESDTKVNRNLYYIDKDKDKDKDIVIDKDADTHIDNLQNTEEKRKSAGGVFPENDFLETTGGTFAESGKTCEEINKRFERLWEQYPKKWGKSQAFEEFKKIDPDDELVEKMIGAIRIQKKSSSWKQDNGRYIPTAAKWLCDGRWQKTEIEAEVSFFGECADVEDQMLDDYIRTIADMQINGAKRDRSG